METCENCGRTIGNLETPAVWRERVVCAECHQRLNGSHARGGQGAPAASGVGHAGQSTAIPYATPLHYVSARPQGMRKGERICPNPNCGYCGPGTREARGSGVIFIILILLWIIPGVIYWALCGGYRIVCPRCGMEWSVELR